MVPCVTCSFYAMIPLMFDKNLLNQGDSSFEYNEIMSSGWWVESNCYACPHLNVYLKQTSS